MQVAQSIGQRQVRPYFPGISEISLKAVIWSKPAAGKSESRFFRREALAVAHNDREHRVSLDVGPEVECGIGVDDRRGSKELGEAATLDAVVSRSIAEDVRAKYPAAVV